MKERRDVCEGVWLVKVNAHLYVGGHRYTKHQRLARRFGRRIDAWECVVSNIDRWHAARVVVLVPR